MSTSQKIRLCEWKDCEKEGRYRMQTSAARDDIHWFCKTHNRMFDLSVVSQGPFFGSAGSNWTQEQSNKENESNQYIPPVNNEVRLKHISKNNTFNYTQEDIKNLNTLGLETGASEITIKKAYKRLVKHCHPDQNPNLENATLIFNRVNEAYNALKDKDFT